MFSFALAEVAGGGDGDGRALLLTGDRDLYQAVNDQVAVVLPGKGGAPPTEIGPAQVRERYGIDPALVTDFIALRGDPSDGLPGAPGIGAKTAAELLNRYGSLEEVLRVAGEDDSGMRLRTAIALSENEELLRTFKRIATLVQIDGIVRPPDRATDFAGGARMAAELGMRQLATRLEKLATAWLQGVRPPPPDHPLAAYDSERSGTELDRQHVAVAHHVVAPLDAQRAALAGTRVAAGVDAAPASRSPRRGRSPSGCRSGSRRRRARR